MAFDYDTLDLLRQNHPGWRLLRSEHAALILSFLHRVFIVPNCRSLSQADLMEALEDELFGLRQRLGNEAFPRSALDYLLDWSSVDKGWLRYFYPSHSDEPAFDLTPAVEKAIQWLQSLLERSFVGTESRLLTLVDLLRQMREGSETDPTLRVAALQARRDEIDAEIARTLSGEGRLLDETALKDRFLQFSQLARDLLSDFREVEYHFRALDRRVRERIALWEGAKCRLLTEIMGERDAIVDSDQGRNFRAFWDYLMSGAHQEQLSQSLNEILALPCIQALKPDARFAQIHYDWLSAGECTQRTVAQLSQQLRRFLDDQAWLENRRIMDLLHGIEVKVLKVRDHDFPSTVMQMQGIGADVRLLMERALHQPVVRSVIDDALLAGEDDPCDCEVLYSQMIFDKPALRAFIEDQLQTKSQVTLQALCDQRPLKHGLVELLAYLQLATERFKTHTDERVIDPIFWMGTDPSGEIIQRQAQLPRLIFVRGL